MIKPVPPLTVLWRRWKGVSTGVRIEERRWRRSIDALHRDCDGLRQRIVGSR